LSFTNWSAPGLEEAAVLRLRGEQSVEVVDGMGHNVGLFLPAFPAIPVPEKPA